MFFSCEFKTADTAADDNTDSVRIKILKVRTAVTHSFHSCCNGKLCETVCTALFLFIYTFVRHKILYLAYDLNVKI